MKQRIIARIARYGGCAALLALLAASSYAGRGTMDTPLVPVMIETVSDQAVTAASLEQTSSRLAQKREEALLLLQSVIDDPQADETSRKQAQMQKVRIAACMETEAAVCALLAHMGFEQTAVVAGEETLSIIAPWQIAENEHNRLQMIDAAVGLSGFSADAVKIILAKN